MTRQPSFPAETSGIHIWLVLWKADRALEAHSERSIEGFDMCRSDFGVLEALLHKGPMPVNELGTKVLLTSGSITTAVDRLERRGLVERRNDRNDRRARIVHLTRTGRKTIAGIFPSHEQAMEQAASALAYDERIVLLALLRKLGLGAQEALPRKRSASPEIERKRND